MKETFIHWSLLHYQIVLTGFVIDDVAGSEPEFIAEKMRKFLQLDGKRAVPSPAATTPVSEASDLLTEEGSTTSDDSFEQINQADLDMLAQQDIGQDDTPNTDFVAEELEKQD